MLVNKKLCKTKDSHNSDIAKNRYKLTNMATAWNTLQNMQPAWTVEWQTKKWIHQMLTNKIRHITDRAFLSWTIKTKWKKNSKTTNEVPSWLKTNLTKSKLNLKVESWIKWFRIRSRIKTSFMPIDIKVDLEFGFS
jgi:hypothetical protein